MSERMNDNEVYVHVLWAAVVVVLGALVAVLWFAAVMHGNDQRTKTNIERARVCQEAAPSRVDHCVRGR